MSHHLIEVRNLHYTYPDGAKALRGVTFTITHGESVGIIGANGAGKSTFLLHLAGVLLPSAGSVRIGDCPLSRSTLAEIRRHVGLIFQNPDDQLFMPAVFEDVVFGPINRGIPRPEAEELALRALETVGAAHLRDRPPYKLSGGEKRAVSIATVLAMTPDILVMDEPSAGLDPLARRRLLRLLTAFSHTKIIATHDLDLVLELCARTIILRDGTVAADGPTSALLRDEALLAASGLEKPLRLQGCPICSSVASL